MRPDALREELRLEQEMLARYKTGGISNFAPNPIQREFLNASAEYREVLLTGGRQTTGKTYPLTAWVAVVMTGRYPKWYTGKRWDRPVRGAGGSKVARLTRDNFCRYLAGPETERGTGWIPRDCFGDIERDIVPMTGGVRGQIDKIRCKWFDQSGIFGGWSELYIFSYDGGRENLQSIPFDFVALDEEPSIEVKQELSARTDKTLGPLLMTFSTMKGYTETIQEFLEPDAAARGRKHIPCSIYDVGPRGHPLVTNPEGGHLSKEEFEAKISKYKGTFLEDPELNGMPNMGEGLIYRTADAEIIEEPLSRLPASWKRIWGIDVPHTESGTFGAAGLAYDEEADTIHLYDAFKLRETSRALACEGLRTRGCDVIPVAWPHDAKRFMAFNADRMREAGINMLSEPAMFELDDGGLSNSVDAVHHEIIERMQTGRFKVSRSCQVFFEEKKIYHTDKTGQPAKAQNNHVIDALHKAVMMLREASIPHDRHAVGTSTKMLGDYEVFQ